MVPERNITALDFVPGRMNNKEQLFPAVCTNTVYIEYRSDSMKCNGITHGLIINNTTLVINYHSYFEDMKMQVYITGKKPGTTGVFEVCVQPRMVRVIRERDLAIITTNAIPALFKDISKNLPKMSNESVGDSILFIRKKDGYIWDNHIAGIKRLPFDGFRGDRGGVNCMALMGHPDMDTESGDCGSPLVINTPYGPIIAGIHAAFDVVAHMTIAVPLYYEDFEHAPMVQVGIVKPAQPDGCFMFFSPSF